MKLIKNIARLSLLCLAMPLIVSCVDLDENPPSDLSPQNFYTSESEYNAALTGIIKALYSDWSGFDYGYDLILASGAEDIRSDADLFKNFDRLVPNDRELVIHDFWMKCYQAISNANTLISKLQNAKDVPAEKLDALEGQARFLRAFTYFYLVRFFGPVQVTTYENQNNIETVKQSSVAEVYDAILEDLSIAEVKLPLSFAEKGRPTRGAAKTLMAKVYLTMTGWPLNDKSYYVLARDKAAEVMDEKYGYDLEDDFADLWKQANKLKSKEFIFTFYGSVAEDGVAGSHMDLATRYFGNGEGGWGDYFSETRFFDVFPEGPRKDATFTSVFADGTTFTEAGVEPFIAKYRDGGRRVNTSSEGFRPILRFADVLLIYAEAANYVNNGPDQAALDAFDRVYKRGRGESSPYTLRTSQNEFDRAVLEERAWEFACEGDRWHDLVRREMVVTANAERLPNVKETARLLPKPGTEIIPGILDQNEY
ncbi:MAG TPA: RagB/SusD family nutrient uptake outer membrane protein [Bacteroides xylanisolvens]|uniref:RagB/SusD family nutrient uptake outer membrane protein n=1 Tax=Bacteroides xylanisolvens TaxID=371601 RepID=A0A921IBP2_9BACE|nr:RagB/SusD family nutrient uptake outer membrane protein [Bacteroides xylanisolvens]